MKKLLTLLTSVFVLSANAQIVNNAGFENGTTSGWGFNFGWTGAKTPSMIDPIAVPGFHAIVTNTSTIGTQCINGLDRYGNFPVVAPDGGNYSMLLNNDTAGSKVLEAGNGFVVTPSNSNVTFRFAVVLQDAGHTDTTKPYFFINLRGYNGINSIVINVFDTSSALTGWQTSAIDPTVHYLPWAAVTMDLSAYMGYEITPSFFVNDCVDGAHFGYAYIDEGFNNYQITSSHALCTIGDSTVLSGPIGMTSYHWSGPKSGTTQNLSTAIPGNYTLTTTSLFNNQSAALYYHLSVDTVVSSFVVNNVCTNSIANFVEQSIGSPNSWQWNFGDGTPTVNTQNPTHTYTTAGNYTTTLITSNSCGASNTTYNTVTIYPLPSPSLNTKFVCYVPQVILMTDSTDVFPTMYWTGPSGGASGPAIQVTDAQHVYNGTYTLTVVDSNNCTITTTTLVAIPTITLTSSSPYVCPGGTATLSASGASSYVWSSGSLTGDSIFVSPTTNTIYTVSGTTTPCLYATTTTITIAPNPTASDPQSHSQTVCSGNSINPINFQAYPPSSHITWVSSNASIGLASSGSGDITGFSAPIVTVPTTDIITAIAIENSTGCQSAPGTEFTYTITIEPSSTVSYTLQKDTSAAYTWDVFPNYSSSITNATWYWGDGTSTSGLSPSHTYSAAGRYNICVTAFSSCGDSISTCQNDSIYRLSQHNSTNSNMIYVNVIQNTTGIHKITSNNIQVNIYPNPSNANFTIETNATTKQTVVVYDVNGRIVLTQAINNKTTIDASALSSGIYNVSITSNEGIVHKRIVISH